MDVLESGTPGMVNIPETGTPGMVDTPEPGTLVGSQSCPCFLDVFYF